MDENPYTSPSAAAAPEKHGQRSDFGPLRMAAAGLFVGAALSSTAGALYALIAWLVISSMAVLANNAPVISSIGSAQDYLANCIAAIVVGALGGLAIGAALGPALGLAAEFATDRSRMRLRLFSLWLIAIFHAPYGALVASVCVQKAGVDSPTMLAWCAILGGIGSAIIGMFAGWMIGKMLGNVAWGKAEIAPTPEDAPIV